MRWFIIPAVLAAALTFAGPSPAKAQVIVGGYPSTTADTPPTTAAHRLAMAA